MEKELQNIKDRRKLIQNNYLELAQEIWSSSLEADKKDYKVRTEYNKRIDI